MEIKCNVSLHKKLEARSGRLQLIVAALFDVARAQMDPMGGEDLEEAALLPLAELANDYGVAWLDETAMLLKELYNRGKKYG